MKKITEKMNTLVQKKQLMNGLIIVGGAIVILLVLFWLGGEPSKKTAVKQETVDMTGLTGSEFTQKNTESALTDQQQDVNDLKKQLASVIKKLEEVNDNQVRTQDDLKALSSEQEVMMENQHELDLKPAEPEKPEQGMPQGLGASYTPYPPTDGSGPDLSRVGQMVHESFHHHAVVEKNNDNYVPPGTYAPAVILGGADVDASVNGQSHESPLLFKLLGNGKIPGGGHSKLKNCVVISSGYGDISSERALIRLKHITCKSGKNKTIDEEIEGWAWYHGKSGIKGVPYMGDGEMMKWAFIGGGIQGAGNALAYNQTTQSVSALGSTTTVNPGEVGQYAAYNGLSTAGSTLANYYIKRADQYHPVIQVGAGNKVTIVFETGFFIVPHDRKGPVDEQPKVAPSVSIPPQILKQIEAQKNQALGQTVGAGS